MKYYAVMIDGEIYNNKMHSTKRTAKSTKTYVINNFIKMSNREYDLADVASYSYKDHVMMGDMYRDLANKWNDDCKIIEVDTNVLQMYECVDL